VMSHRRCSRQERERELRGGGVMARCTAVTRHTTVIGSWLATAAGCGD